MFKGDLAMDMIAKELAGDGTRCLLLKVNSQACIMYL